jgi:hypothetical protein
MKEKKRKDRKDRKAKANAKNVGERNKPRRANRPIYHRQRRRTHFCERHGAPQ